MKPPLYGVVVGDVTQTHGNLATDAAVGENIKDVAAALPLICSTSVYTKSCDRGFSTRLTPNLILGSLHVVVCINCIIAYILLSPILPFSHHNTIQVVNFFLISSLNELQKQPNTSTGEKKTEGETASMHVN